MGVSATVNNLHSFITEEVQRVIDHVNSEMVKVCSRLDKLDSEVQKLQSVSSPPAIAAAPIYAVAPVKPSSPSEV